MVKPPHHVSEKTVGHLVAEDDAQLVVVITDVQHSREDEDVASLNV